MMIYFQDADRDGSGSVDFKEFVELMIKREAEKETIDDLKQVFRVFDKVIYCKTIYGAQLMVTHWFLQYNIKFRMEMVMFQLRKSNLF